MQELLKRQMEEFEEKFPPQDYFFERHVHESVKNFLHQSQQELLEEIKEECYGRKFMSSNSDRRSRNNYLYTEDYRDGYNQALEDIINQLK